MLFSLFSNLVDIFSFFNVFKYLTVRTGLSMFTSMIVVFVVGNPSFKKEISFSFLSEERFISAE